MSLFFLASLLFVCSGLWAIFQCWSTWTGKQSMAERFLGPSSRRLCDQFRSCDTIWAREWWHKPAPAQGAPLQLLMAEIISISNFRQDHIPQWQQISPNGSEKLTLFIALIIHSFSIYCLPVSEVLWTCSDVTFLVSSLLPTLFKITISCPIQHSLLSPLLYFSPYRVSDAALSKIRTKICWVPKRGMYFWAILMELENRTQIALCWGVEWMLKRRRQWLNAALQEVWQERKRWVTAKRWHMRGLRTEPSDTPTLRDKNKNKKSP